MKELDSDDSQSPEVARRQPQKKFDLEEHLAAAPFKNINPLLRPQNREQQLIREKSPSVEKNDDEEEEERLQKEAEEVEKDAQEALKINLAKVKKEKENAPKLVTVEQLTAHLPTMEEQIHRAEVYANC